MTQIMLVYPVMIMLVGAYLLPFILNEFGDADAGQYLASVVIVLVLGSLAPFIGGAMFGFLLLDHRDENTLISLRVTPTSLGGYLGFKATYIYLLSVASSLMVLSGVKWLSGDGYTVMGRNVWDGFSFLGILGYAVVAAWLAPIFGLLLASLGKNKIEGFAYMKSLGIFALLPVLVVLEPLQDARQYLLGIMPSFWPLKGLMVDAGLLENSANLSYALYLFIGLVWSVLLCALFIKLFYQKVQES
jgi:fluoroquinolone transport system permease protein